MKKLNRKGFTLIELLAIIVILAIIMVVTIPTMLDMMGNATTKEFKNSVDAVEKYVTDQYTLATVGSASAPFIGICGATGSDCISATTATPLTFGASTPFTADTNASSFITAAGQDPKNYKEMSVLINQTTNRVCIKALPNPDQGSFKGVSVAASKYICSNGCGADSDCVSID